MGTLDVHHHAPHPPQPSPHRDAGTPQPQPQPQPHTQHGGRRLRKRSPRQPKQIPKCMGDWAMLGRIAGNTYRAVNVRDDQVAVAKLFNTHKVPHERILNEQNMLRLVSGHRNIAKLLAAVTCTADSSCTALITESGETDVQTWMDHTRCHLHSITAATAARAQKRLFAKQLLGAVEFLHSKDIIHNSVMLSNCVVTRHSTLKLVEFGRAERIVNGNGGSSTFGGSLGYMAPEVVNQCSHGKPADMFSFGVCLFQLASADGSRPFRRTSLGDYKCDIAQESYRKKLHKCPLVLRPTITGKLFQVNPCARLTATDLLSHPWFRYGPSASSSLLSEESEPGRGYSLCTLSSPPMSDDDDTPTPQQRDRAKATIRRLAREHLATSHGSRTLTKHQSLPTLRARSMSPEHDHVMQMHACSSEHNQSLSPDCSHDVPLDLEGVRARWAETPCQDEGPLSNRPASCQIDEDLILLRTSINGERLKLRHNVQQLVNLASAMKQAGSADVHVQIVPLNATQPRKTVAVAKSRKRLVPPLQNRRPHLTRSLLERMQPSTPNSPSTPTSPASRSFLYQVPLQPRNRFQ